MFRFRIVVLGWLIIGMLLLIFSVLKFDIVNVELCSFVGVRVFLCVLVINFVMWEVSLWVFLFWVLVIIGISNLCLVVVLNFRCIL